ncbi:MAG: TetR/AcrR family transcriptional regulator [Deltaproteobacteria bacterium]|nr:TetR/AcrR family transcriptional regulator [Deltaproteobacteria bacterium]
MGGKRNAAGKKAASTESAAGAAAPAAAQDVAARKRLLKSALGLFNRKGYASASVREIVAAAGVSKPVLYYYFRNKEGIYLDLMREEFSRFDALLEASRGVGGSAAERIRRLCGGAYVLFREHIEVPRLMYAIYYGPPQGAPFFDFDAYHIKFQENVQELVEEGIRTGEFRKGDAGDMTWAVIGAVNVAMEMELCHPEIALGKEGLGRVLDVIFAGIAGDRGKFLRRAASRDRKKIRRGEAR